ncbi:MAG: hypothetical protein ACKOB3_05040 [Holophagaceae bacterium]
MENLLKILSVLEHGAYALSLLSFAGYGLSPERGLFLAVLGLAAARWQDTLGKKC